MSNETLRRLRNLRTTNKHISPDAAWVRATRATLLMQVKNNLPTKESVTSMGRVRGAINAFMPRSIGSWAHSPMIAVMSAIAVLTGGSIMSVSAAEQALPGDLLYSLKLATEQARLAFTPVIEEKIKLKTEFNTRRINELRDVADDTDHPDRVVRVTEILKSDLNTLQQQLDEVVENSSTENAAAAAKLVDKSSTEVISALQETKGQLSPENQEKVTEAQTAAADTSVKAIETLADAHLLSSDIVSAADVEQAIKDHAQVVSDATSGSLVMSTSTSGVLLASTSTSQILVDMTSSSTVVTATTTLAELVEQVKEASAQAFATQIAKEQLAVSVLSTVTAPLETTSSTGSTDATSAPSTTTSTLPTTPVSSTNATLTPP